QTAQRPTEAIAAHRRAVDLLRALAAESPHSHADQQELALALVRLATVLHAGDTGEAVRLLREALALQDGLVGRMPKVRDYRDERGRTCTHLAAVHYAQENAQEAEGLYRRAERDFRELVNSYPGEPEYRQLLAACLVNLGELLRHTKRPDDALS